MAEDAKKRNNRQYKWQKENKDRINFTMPKGRKEQIKEAAERADISPSEWINNAIVAKLNDLEDIRAARKGPDTQIDLAEIQELEVYARSAGMSLKKYAELAIKEKMRRQEEGFKEDIERVTIDIC